MSFVKGLAQGLQPLHPMRVFCSEKCHGVRNRATFSDSRSNFHTRVGYRTNVCRRRLASDLARASEMFRPKGLSRITMTGYPVPNAIELKISFTARQ
jgi:hypothetical protein